MRHNKTILYKKLEIITNILNPIIPNKKIKAINFPNKSDFQAPKINIIIYVSFRSLVQKLN
jgi:hypothetical protein